MSALLRRSARYGALTLIVGLAAPAGAAQAAPGDPNTVSMAGNVITAVAEDGKADQILVEQESANVVTLRSRAGGIGSTWPDVNLSPSGGPGTPRCFFDDDMSGFYRRIRCENTSPIARVIVHGRDNNDQIHVTATFQTFAPVELRGGDGNDSLIGGDEDDDLHGDAGNDTLRGDAGDDTLRGDDGNDTLRGDDGDDKLFGGEDRDSFFGGAGADDMHGDGGFDSVLYSDRPADQPVSVSLDDAANDGGSVDGALGKGDNARKSIEDVFGSQGGDEIKGSEFNNELHGNAGNDAIDGGAGADKFIGGPASDTILSRDGGAERVDCGEDPGDGDADVAKTDNVDEVTGCETHEPSGTVEPDRDRDGFNAPPDCDDDNKGIHPGAHDVPENGIDENCDNVDAINTDRDGDGVTSDVDCDDTNPNAKPGGTEILGNEADEDCDRLAPPIPVIETPVLQFFRHRRGKTFVKNLGVGAVPEGTTAKVTCIGGKRFGCPVKSKKKVFKRASKKGVNWTRHFRRAKLRKGATIIVEITKPGFVGRHVIFRIRPKAAPVPRPLCLFPNEKKAREC